MNKNLKLFNICCLLIFLLALNVQAWETQGKDLFNTYRDGTSVGNWVNDSLSPSTISDSPDFNVVSIDLDGDLDREIIYSDGTYLRIRNDLGGLVDELNLGSTILSPITVQDNGSDVNILFTNSTHFFNYQYNTTDFVQIVSNIIYQEEFGNVPRTSINKSITCSANSKNICGFMNDYANICKVDIAAGTQFCYAVINTTISNFQADSAINTMGGNDVLFTKYDTNSIIAFDLSTNGLYTTFDGDGILDISTAGIYHISDPTVYNVNGVGDSEVLINHVWSNAGNTFARVEIYNSDASAYLASPYQYFTVANTGGFTTAMPVGIVVNPSLHVCSGGYSGVFREIACLDLSGTEYNYDNNNLSLSSYSAGSSGFGGIKTNLAIADMTGDGSDEIILPSGIFSLSGTHLYNTRADTDSKFIIDDFSNAGDIGIWKYTSSNQYLYQSTYSNQPPTIYNNLTYGGYGSSHGFTSPICLNTTVTYSAQECGGTVTSCNYDNDGANDQERIVSNCGTNADPSLELVEGTLSLANPIYQCVFNETGNYNLRLYLVDNQNSGDRTQYNTQTITVNVIDGVEGVTCNVDGTTAIGSETVATGDEGLDSDVDSTLGILLGTSQTLRLIVGMALLIGIIVMVAQHTHNGFALAASGIAGLVMLVFLGLIPGYIMMIIVISLLALVFLGKFLLHSGTDGGV